MKKGVLKNFTKFTGKHLCQSLVSPNFHTKKLGETTVFFAVELSKCSVYIFKIFILIIDSFMSVFSFSSILRACYCLLASFFQFCLGCTSLYYIFIIQLTMNMREMQNFLMQSYLGPSYLCREVQRFLKLNFLLL